jgi:peroxiredoxin
MKKNHLLAAGVLALVLLAALFWYRDWQSAPRKAPEGIPPLTAGTGGQMAPSFFLTDTSGNKVSSSQFLGKPTVINFFATWCPPCREEIPGFVEIYDKYRGRGFELVGISFDTDTKGNLPAFMMRNRIGYRILLGDVATARAYGGVSTIPTTFFVGKDGRIRNVVVGYIDKDDFELEVQKLL